MSFFSCQRAAHGYEKSRSEAASVGQKKSGYPRHFCCIRLSPICKAEYIRPSTARQAGAEIPESGHKMWTNRASGHTYSPAGELRDPASSARGRLRPCDGAPTPSHPTDSPRISGVKSRKPEILGLICRDARFPSATSRWCEPPLPCRQGRRPSRMQGRVRPRYP
jgi:hypothetical protein